MKSVFLAIVGLSCLATLPAAFAEEIYQRSVQLPDLEQSEIAAVVLPPEIYPESRKDLGDLRLLSSDDREISYLISPLYEISRKRQEVSFPAELEQVEKPETESLTVELSTPKKQPVARIIRLITPLQNFERRISVQGSAKGEKWQPLVEDALVFDYKQYIDARNMKIELPEHSFRHLRLKIDDLTVEQESRLLELTNSISDGKLDRQERRLSINRQPFRIDRIECVGFRQRQQKTAVTRQYPVRDWKVEESENQSTTNVLLDVAQVPLTSLDVVTDSNNFERIIQLWKADESGKETEWKPVKKGTLSRLKYPDLVDQENLELEFPEIRARQLKLEIRNLDSAPIKITDVNVVGPVYQLLFLAEPGEQYRLTYGHLTRQPPDYDQSLLSRAVDKNVTPVSAQLGKATRADVDRKLVNWWKHPIIWGSLLTMLTILLSYSLWRAIIRVDNLDSEKVDE